MESLKPMIEALLFVAGEEGISLKELAEVTEHSQAELELLIHELRVDWKEQHRGLQIEKVAQMYQITTIPTAHLYVEKWAQVPTRSSLSRAALETLAIIAYRQPITRLGIEEIRGVKSDRILQSLGRKGLIREAGRTDGIGRPILYGTSKEFLEYLGLNHLDELPEADSVFQLPEREQERQNLSQQLGIEES